MTNIYEDGPAKANRTRARWAVVGLKAFGKETGQQDYVDESLNVSEDELTEIAGDLLANLFHLARINGVSAEELVRVGYLHYDEEVQEEEAEEGEE